MPAWEADGPIFRSGRGGSIEHLGNGEYRCPRCREKAPMHVTARNWVAWRERHAGEECQP